VPVEGVDEVLNEHGENTHLYILYPVAVKPALVLAFTEAPLRSGR